MKTTIENNDLSHEWYVVEIDGKFGSRYGVYIEALKAGMELSRSFRLALSRYTTQTKHLYTHNGV